MPLTSEASIAEPNPGLEKDKETSIPRLATHLAWTIAELSKDLERFQRMTDWPSKEISIWLKDVCHRIAMHLAFMRRQGPSSLLLNYPWQDMSVVLLYLRNVHDFRSSIRSGFKELEGDYDHRLPRRRQVVGRLAAVLQIHGGLGSACTTLAAALKVLDQLREKRPLKLNYGDVQFSRLNPSDRVTLRHEYNMCCSGADLILERSEYIDTNILRADLVPALQMLKSWGTDLFPVHGPGLDELFDFDDKTTASTRELLHRIFGLILICQGQLVDSVLFELDALTLEQRGDTTEETFRTLKPVQQEMTKVLTSRDQIYLATACWAGTIATSNGETRKPDTLDDYQRVIKNMVDVLWEMVELLFMTARRLRRLVGEFGQEWPLGPRDSPGVFSFMQVWRPEEMVPEAFSIGALLEFWVRKRGHFSPAITEVIITFAQYESALTDILQRPPPTEPQQDVRKDLRKYPGGYLIWRHHLLGAWWCLAVRCQELVTDERDGIRTGPLAAAADLKADSILKHWSELQVQIPGARKKYTDIFGEDVEPS